MAPKKKEIDRLERKILKFLESRLKADGDEGLSSRADIGVADQNWVIEFTIHDLAAPVEYPVHS